MRASFVTRAFTHTNTTTHNMNTNTNDTSYARNMRVYELNDTQLRALLRTTRKSTLHARIVAMSRELHVIDTSTHARFK